MDDQRGGMMKTGGNSGAAGGGFTLLEVMVAVAIMAIIGVTAARSLNALAATREAMQKRQTALARVEIFFTLIDQDLRVMVPRKINGPDGVMEPFKLSADPFPTLAITRSGVRAARMPPGPLRVLYVLKDGVISRRLRFVQGRDGEMSGRDLITGVKSITVLPVAGKGDEAAAGKESSDQARVPTGVRVTVDIAGYGTVSRLFYIGVGR